MPGAINNMVAESNTSCGRVGVGHSFRSREGGGRQAPTTAEQEKTKQARQQKNKIATTAKDLFGIS